MEARSIKMDSLSRGECMDLLSAHPARIGRVALAGPRPQIFPVNYALDGEAIVFRTARGTKLDRAVRGEFVAFEVDEVYPGLEAGWSVLIRGQAEEVTDPKELERMESLELRAWAPGEKGHFVRVRPDIVSGRRIV